MKISYKHPILVLLPLMEIEMTHTAYFFSFTFKTISLFSPCLIGLLFYSKFTQEKTLVPITLNFQKKNKQEVRDLLGPINPTKGKTFLNSASNYSRKLSWDNSKKSSKIILVKKKKKQSLQLEILLIRMLKTLISFLHWNSFLK